jgi:hypothetical protein
MDASEMDGFSGVARKDTDNLISSAPHKTTIRWPNGHTSSGYHLKGGLNHYQVDY